MGNDHMHGDDHDEGRRDRRRGRRWDLERELRTRPLRLRVEWRADGGDTGGAAGAAAKGGPCGG